MRTFQVPVWFNIQAKDQDEAWEMVDGLLGAEFTYDKLPDGCDWAVEEPIDVTAEDI